MKKIIANNFANPYLPLWEHIPDGEPRVFEDPDNPGKYRAYVIGSHDVRHDSYCGPDIHAWSAPVENLQDWRDEGSIFTYHIDDQYDVMYAPDLVEVKRKDGTKDYYLYPHSRGPRREAMVCKGPTPVGPFTPINLTADGRATTPESILGFDPAVYVEYITDPADPDYEIGFRAYGYWGFQKSHAAELDQNTMYSLRPGTQIINHFIPASSSYGNVHDPAGTTYPHVHPDADLQGFNFFEAASIRKIGNKYVWIFSGYSGPEYGMSSSNSTLRYAYGDSLLGPWKDGGVLVDARSVELNQDGSDLALYYGAHNTHGSIELIGDQWYCFYHRPPRAFGFARQAMVAPIQVQADETPVADGGRVLITGWSPDTQGNVWTKKAANSNEYRGAEMTSEGFNIYGLNPYKYYSAGIACFLSDHSLQADAWDIWNDHMSITGVKAGDIVGYKYFGFGGLAQGTKGLAPFEGTKAGNNTHFNLYLTPKTTESFAVKLMLHGPWDNSAWGGKEIATITVPAGAPNTTQVFTADVSAIVDSLDGKHALYLVAEGGAGELCDIIGLGFSAADKPLTPPVVPSIAITINGDSVQLPTTPVRANNRNGLCGYDQYEFTVAGYTHPINIVGTSDVDMNITVNPPTEAGANAQVIFDYQGVVKTYTVIFENFERTETTVHDADGHTIKEYSIKNDDLELKFLNLGGAITKIAMSVDNFEQNLVLNHAEPSMYIENPGYLNALVGRTSNRITNGTFDIHAKSYTVELNDGPNNLHGGSDNLTHAYFDVAVIPNGYQLTTKLAHQPNGFPGDLAVMVTYILDGNKLKITYTGTSDHLNTIFNPTQHAYFNLSGNASEDINGHVLQIDANRVAEINDKSSFTKTLLPVEGTCFDFQVPVAVDPSNKPSHPIFELAGGYDHLFVLNQNYDRRPAVMFTHPASKRQLAVYTSEPTVQFYAANHMSANDRFEGGVIGKKNHGACFETHKNPFDFASQVIDPGVATVVQTTVWEFSKGQDKVINIAPRKETE